MATLNDISGLNDQAKTLLEAIDVNDSDDLAREDIGSLYARLYQTNKEQNIFESLPGIEKIEAWIEEARQLTNEDAPPADEENDKDSEDSEDSEDDSGDSGDEPDQNDTDERNEETASPETQPAQVDSLAADLAAAASPLDDAPETTLEEEATAEASVDDSPASPDPSSSHATLLLGLENDVWMEAYDQAAEAIVLEAAPVSSLPEPPEDATPKRKRFRKPDRPADPLAIQSPPTKRSKRRKDDPAAAPGAHHPPRKDQSLGSDNPANLGGHGSALKTKSRLPTETSLRIATATEDLPKYARRGLLHPQPIAVACGFLVVIITRILIVAMLVGTPIVLMYFSDYILYFAAVPALLVLFALFYVVFSSKVFCRVCGTNVLIPQKSHKHEKAHHLFGFGHVGSTALHGLFFGWFRCLQCGTPMRIRE
jgi:hypothetical protein